MLSVQTNISAWNADRQFNIISGKKRKSTEKLSSGYRINRSADDAAGLAISEKMRRQIRGLRQGEENIQEGISLVQVAEGSLNEVTDILQRINELSVKAYNGTNQEEDRNYIQAEITQLVKEIERIADVTTFNEIPLLKGEPAYWGEIEAVITKIETRDDVCKGLPAWLKNRVDKELKVQPQYTEKQDANGVMLQTVKNNGSLTYHYYGPNIAGKNIGETFTYGNKNVIYSGSWTGSIQDNPSAKISFQGLIDASTDAKSLYDNMFDLIGGSIGVPCGTCNQYYYGINFLGSERGYTARPVSYSFENNALSGGNILAGGELNLSEWKIFESERDSGKKLNCFDRITELAEKHEKDKTLTDAQKEIEVRALADEIAKALCDATCKLAKDVTDGENHFDRLLKYDDYSVIIYDYRDDKFLTQSKAADSTVFTAGRCEVEIKSSEIGSVSALLRTPLEIQASEKSGDRIPIELPVISAETLGISGYDVARYSVKEIYTGQYYKKLEKYEKDWEKYREDYRIWRDNCEFETKKITQNVDTVVGYNDVYVNGEKRKEPVIQTVPVDFIETKLIADPDNPPPSMPKFFEIEEGDIIRQKVYDPDNNRKIKDSLEYVLMCRTRLGATQNRLEHAYNIDANSEENTASAESQLRDTDIAKEMMDFSNYRIIQEAGSSMLSQANQSSGLILQLLK